MSLLTKQRLICLLLLGCIAGAVFLSYAAGQKYRRLLFYFQRTDGQTIGTEERYVPHSAARHPAVTVVEELLLGPFRHEFLHITDPDIPVNRCFVRKDAVYIDLPAQVLSPRVKTSDFHTAYRLLKKNIVTNCKDIRTVYLYIDGVPAYQKD